VSPVPSVIGEYQATIRQGEYNARQHSGGGPEISRDEQIKSGQRQSEKSQCRPSLRQCRLGRKEENTRRESPTYSGRIERVQAAYTAANRYGAMLHEGSRILSFQKKVDVRNELPVKLQGDYRHPKKDEDYNARTDNCRKSRL
jgi:hypothetical protein